MSNKTEAGPAAPIDTLTAAQAAQLARGFIRERTTAWDRENLHDCISRLEALAAHPPAQEQPVPEPAVFVPQVVAWSGGALPYRSVRLRLDDTPQEYEYAPATHPTPAERAEQPQAEQELRELLARSVAGAALYADDGELQDASELPAIDFKRDAPGEIARKLTDRGLKRLTRAEQPRDVQQGLTEALAAERERLCAAIKAEDDYSVTEGDYMLDSDDCISIIRGTWKRPDFSPSPSGATLKGQP